MFKKYVAVKKTICQRNKWHHSSRDNRKKCSYLTKTNIIGNIPNCEQQVAFEFKLIIRSSAMITTHIEHEKAKYWAHFMKKADGRSSLIFRQQSSLTP